MRYKYYIDNTTSRLPAYRDSSLRNRQGEDWKDVPGLEGYYLISNLGRLKRVERIDYDVLGRKFTRREKIILAALNKNYNKCCGDYKYALQVDVQIDKVKYPFQIHRMVYYCFVKPFDFTDHSINIIVNEGDGLDVRPQNLRMVTLSEKAQRPYDVGRQLQTFEYDERYKERAVQASKAITSKTVSQFSDQGQFIGTYSSIIDAVRQTGISHARISYAAGRLNGKTGHFYWRYGQARTIDMQEIAHMNQQRWQSYKEKQGTKVTQYDIDGNPIAHFAALSEAAKATHISHKSLTTHIKGLSTLAGGYRWQKGYGSKKLDPLPERILRKVRKNS